ncbi:MAG TPA: group I intron-associated PD-(D/E)XK endonuclease [Terriglobales bacterium]
MHTDPRVPTKPPGGVKSMLLGDGDNKRLGEIGELAFILKATSLGITASRPFGDRRPYDFVVEYGPSLLRIQVKSVFSRKKRDAAYQVVTSHHGRKGRATYTAEQIDFIAAYIVPRNLWYVIPVEALAGRKVVRVYPCGKTKKPGGLFEIYREAWDLLKRPAEKSP